MNAGPGERVPLVGRVLGDMDVDANSSAGRPSTIAASVSSDRVNEACAPIMP
jgi:hypothetical protein